MSETEVLEPCTTSTVAPVLLPLPAPVVGSLSPTRAAEFKTCPLLYRFRHVDRLPQRPSPAAARGTLVHAVLEQLFDLPARGRTLQAARALLPTAWQQLCESDTALHQLFAGPDGPAAFAEWFSSAGELLGNYFTLEDPSAFEPLSREQLVEVQVDGVVLRGCIDRTDLSPAGELRIVDYKTGASPRESFEGRALFQLKFYALVIWRTRGVVPKQLRLIYLADSDTLSYQPDVEELARFERTVLAVWAAISEAMATGNFQPNPSRLCDWCDHTALCPAFGGTPPPYPIELPVPVPVDPATRPEPAG